MAHLLNEFRDLLLKDPSYLQDLLSHIPRSRQQKILETIDFPSDEARASFDTTLDAKTKAVNTLFPGSDAIAQDHFDELAADPNWYRIVSDNSALAKFLVRMVKIRARFAKLLPVPVDKPAEYLPALLKAIIDEKPFPNLKEGQAPYESPKFPESLPALIVSQLSYTIEIMTSPAHPASSALLINYLLAAYGMTYIASENRVAFATMDAMAPFEETFIKTHLRFSEDYENIRKAKAKEGKLDDLDKSFDASLAAAIEAKKFSDDEASRLAAEKADQGAEAAKRKEEQEQKAKDDSLKIQPYTDTRVSVDFSTYVAVRGQGKVSALLSMPQMARYDVVSTKLKVMKWDRTLDSLRTCIRVNDFDDMAMRDVVTACILVTLSDSDAIEINFVEEAGAARGEVAAEVRSSLISQAILDRWSPAAKTMLIAAIHEFSQPARDEEIKWYGSFTAVYGSFIGEGRFKEVIRLIQQTAALESAFSFLTVGDLRAENNVLKYRLTRLTSPSLVMTAMKMISGTKAVEYIDPTALASYRVFHEAGLPAQIAAGPLKAFCKGTINPLVIKEVPGFILLKDLAPIDQAPYDTRLLKQAKFILEVFNVPHGKWYQGTKVMAQQDPKDLFFRDLLRAIRDKQAQEMEVLVRNVTKEVELRDWADKSRGAQVEEVLKNWSETR